MTHTIVNMCLHKMALTEAKQIHKNACNRNQARKALQRRYICLTHYDHDFILYEIKRQENILY